MIFRQDIDTDELQDLINLENGLFRPLAGFMKEADYRGAVDDMELASGGIFTLPVTLAVSKDIYENAVGKPVELFYSGEPCGDILVESAFKVKVGDIEKVFATDDENHPGVQKESARLPFRIGGKIKVTNKRLLEGSLNADTTASYFKKMGWKTVAGFQTRNPIHNAHEHLQRTALDICDGLFINPIIGWKKIGDFTEDAVMAAYEQMALDFYPKDRVYLAGLRTQMRYAGPREAVFHAIIRRNLGCTHFVIGRDHAGVGEYYSAYAAHELARFLSEKCDLGVNLLLFREPYYCAKCGFVVSDNTCSHYETHRVEISGTIIRDRIRKGEIPSELFMRPEIAKAILAQKQIFVE